jgi:NodT family efflux transporter outer membrane factor (OMF) lipoprotein
MKRLAPWFALTVAGFVSACEVGPDYMRPATPMSMAFRENKGWMPASPRTAAGWEAWWSIYDDPVLDGLEKQVDISNQNLKSAEAAYRAARADVGVQRGALFPEFGTNFSAQRSGGGARNTTVVTGGGGGTGTLVSGAKARTTYQADLSGSWDIDVWGRIRRTVESSVATAQASAADIAAARLSAQSTLAADYFQLRATDEEARILAASVKDFQTALEIAQNKFKAGVATQLDVLEAQTQIDGVQAQLVNVQLTRAQVEHAIAVLVGKPPSDVAVELAPLTTIVPVIPANVPSDLLQRRPDIAASEYDVAAANAQIGVAVAAWYPDLTLGGSYGFASAALGSLFSAPNAAWSVGPALAETIFNGGARVAQTEGARARYDQSVATYRQTVLAAFQQVEDELAALRVLEQQAVVENRTVADARQSELLTLNQYRAGIVDFTTVLTAQTTRLNAENAALNVLDQRLAASVQLVVALGGGWDATRVPQPGTLYTLPETTRDEGPGAGDAKAAAAGAPILAETPAKMP